MNSLKVGLIGLGMMGRQHSRVLASLQGVDFLGICDPIAEEGPTSQNRPVFREIDSLINLGLDYAVIAVPTKDHREIALLLADSGINALIEKPISSDVQSGKELVETFADKKLLGAVGHIERFNPAVIEAKKRLSLLGEIYQITTSRQGPFPGRVSDIGVAKDLATHDIDLTRWITNQEYVDISARASYRSGRSNEDMIVSSANLNHGTISNHIVNWLSPKKERQVVLIGKNGSFIINTLEADLTFCENGTSNNDWDQISLFRGVSEGDVVRFAIDKREPLVVEHENFRDALLGLPSDLPTLEEGLKAIEIADAMLTSARERTTVFL